MKVYRCFLYIIICFCTCAWGQEGQHTNPPLWQWYEIRWDIDLPKDADSIRLTLPFPPEKARLHGISEVLTDTQAFTTFTDSGRKYIRYSLDNPQKGKFSISLYLKVWLKGYDLNNPPLVVARPGFFARKQLLAAEKNIESDSELIRKAAEVIADGENDVETARNIVIYIKKQLKYSGLSRGTLGAESALTKGKGDCTEYTDLFVALARAKGIMARHISGLLVRGSSFSGHSWAEFYSTGRREWVPVDPLHIAIGATGFGIMEANYITLSASRNDRNLNYGLLYHWKIDGVKKANVRMSLKKLDHSPVAVPSSTLFSRIQ